LTDHIVMDGGEAVNINMKFFSYAVVEFVGKAGIQVGVDVVEYMIAVVPHAPRDIPEALD
jgi:hypothetical protein